jgi:ankyrin repeat protein
MNEDIIRALIGAGADSNERNKKGITPLSLAK